MIDRRFGTINKFGTTNKFGASSGFTSLLIWGIEVDWDGDYLFESNEAQYMTGIRGSRGRPKYITRNGQGFEKISTGRYYVTLDNSTGRFDAWNTNSELYPNVIYGRDVRITVKSIASGVTYPVFLGVIEDIQPVNDVDGKKSVNITIVDGWQFLRNDSVSYPMQTSVSPNTAIGYVLDAVQWPSRWDRDLDSVADVINYWWANGNKTAAAIVEDIAESFLGYFFIGANGKATFRSRTNVGVSVIDLSSTQLLKNPSLPQPWEYSRNVIRIKVHPRVSASSGVIYQLVGTTPSIAPGSSIEFFGNYTYNNEAVPATNIIQPVAGILNDWATNTQSDGGGVDKTSECSVVAVDFGDVSKFTVANNSAVTVYLVRLQLRGEALYEPNISDVVYYAPGYKKLPREFRLDLLWQQDINVATDLSNLIGPHLAELHPFPTVKLEDQPDVQFVPDLFDVATLNLPTLGISGESYRVAYIEHESLSENCQAVRTTFGLESYISAEDFWAWDTASDFDSTTVFGA